MTRCCDWQPDPTVFGPCPHCRPVEVVKNVPWFTGMLTRPSLADLTQGATP